MIKFKNFNDLLKIEGMRQERDDLYILDMEDTIQFRIHLIKDKAFVCNIEWLINEVTGWTTISSISCISVDDAVDKIAIAVARCNKGIEDANFSLKCKVKGSKRVKKLHPPVCWRGLKIINQTR